jgi:hypothetical protein
MFGSTHRGLKFLNNDKMFYFTYDDAIRQLLETCDMSFCSNLENGKEIQYERKKEGGEGLKGIKDRKKGGEGRKYETIPVAFSRVF